MISEVYLSLITLAVSLWCTLLNRNQHLHMLKGVCGVQFAKVSIFSQLSKHHLTYLLFHTRVCRVLKCVLIMVAMSIADLLLVAISTFGICDSPLGRRAHMRAYGGIGTPRRQHRTKHLCSTGEP